MIPGAYRSLVFAFITGACVLACSSTSSPLEPPRLRCDSVADAPHCGGAFEFACTGPGAPNATFVNLSGGQCDGGTPAENGVTRYCCTGCTTVGSPAQCGGPGLDVDWTSSLCTTDITPITSPAIPLDANDKGQTPYCFPKTYSEGADYCLTNSSIACTSGIGVHCNGNHEPPQGAGFTCSDGQGSDRLGYEFCCGGGGDGCTKGKASTSVAKATEYDCSGSSRPEETDPSLACGGGIVVSDMPNSFNVTMRYACISFASKTCKRAALSSCVAEGLFGFTCTGTSKPSDAAPALKCSLPMTGDAGAASFCCKAS
jgi:hypothetical protein